MCAYVKKIGKTGVKKSNCILAFREIESESKYLPKVRHFT